MKKTLIIITLMLMSFGASAQVYKEKDKQLHFFSGMTVAGVAYELSDGDFLWTVGTAAFAGLAKELVDIKYSSEGFDVVDLGATVLGGVVSYGLGEIGIPGGIIGITGLTGFYFRMNL